MKPIISKATGSAMGWLLILSLVMTAGCFGGSRASSYTNSKSLSKYTQLAFNYASSGHWVETHKYLNLLNNDGWTPTKLYLTGMDALHRGKAVNRSGRSMSLSKDEKKLGLIFIYLSALGKFSMAESELGLLYSEGNYYLGKINVLKAYYWFSRAVNNPHNSFNPETLNSIKKANFRHKNKMTPAQIQWADQALQNPRFIMRL